MEKTRGTDKQTRGILQTHQSAAGLVKIANSMTFSHLGQGEMNVGHLAKKQAASSRRTLGQLLQW